MNTKNYFFFSIVLFLSITLLSCSSEEITEKEDEFNTTEVMDCACQDLFLDDLYNHFYLEDRTQPYTGHCQGLDNKGNLFIEKDFLKGKLQGTVILYYESGTIKEETEFNSNFQHGISKKYDESGQLIYHSEFYKGELKKNLLQ